MRVQSFQESQDIRKMHEKGLHSTRDEKVDKKSDRGGSREQFQPGLRSARGFRSQVLLG